MKADIDALFKYWLRTINRGYAISERIGPTRFKVLTAAQPAFMARVRPRAGTRPTLVEVCGAFLAQIEQDIACNAHALAVATLLQHPEKALDSRTRGLLTAGVWELAGSFLLLHELFHICCGHVGWYLSKGNTSAAGYDELNMGATTSGIRRAASPAARNAARYREMEADNSAIQWLLRVPLPLSLRRLYQQHLGLEIDRHAPILELNGEGSAHRVRRRAQRGLVDDYCAGAGAPARLALLGRWDGRAGAVGK